jgi:ABC-2 type transport system permease protein
MRAYLAVLKARFAILIQYRAAALAGLLTQFFWGILKIMILTAFYAQASGIQPISLEQAVTFIWMGQALLQLLPWNIDKEIEAQVKSGNVAFELIRPLDLYWLWFCRSMAMRLVPTLLRSIPLFVLAGLFLGFAPPISWPAAAAFGASLVFSALLSSAITTLVIMTLFWTVSGEGILRLLPHVVVVFSGMIVPLPLFPEWMQPFLNIQPFRFIIDIPCRLYTGVIPSSEALYYLAFQSLWVLGFVIAGRFLMKKAINQFVIQGG